jgi:hypothetical protein
MDNSEQFLDSALMALQSSNEKKNERAMAYALISIAQSLIDLKKVVGEDGAIDCWVQVAK